MDADGDFVIAWYSLLQDGSFHGIYAQRYNAAGVAQGPEFRVNSYTTSFQIAPAVAMDADGDFVIAWMSTSQDGSSWGIYAQRYNAQGVAQGGEFRVNSYTTAGQAFPALAMDDDGDFVVAWQSGGQDGSGDGVYAQRYSVLGVPIGSEFRVNSYTADSQYNVALAMDDDGDFVVAWQSVGQNGSYNGVYAQRYRDSSGGRVIDNGDMGFATSGGWQVYAGPEVFQGDLHFIASGTGGATASWSFTGLIPGASYRVSATWFGHPIAASNATYQVTGGAFPLTVTVNQRQAPSSFGDAGTTWQDLAGSHTVTGDALTVMLTDLANGYVCGAPLG